MQEVLENSKDEVEEKVWIFKKLKFNLMMKFGEQVNHLEERLAQREQQLNDEIEGLKKQLESQLESVVTRNDFNDRVI